MLPLDDPRGGGRRSNRPKQATPAAKKRQQLPDTDVWIRISDERSKPCCEDEYQVCRAAGSLTVYC